MGIVKDKKTKIKKVTLEKQELVEINGEQKIKITNSDGTSKIYGL